MIKTKKKKEIFPLPNQETIDFLLTTFAVDEVTLSEADDAVKQAERRIQYHTKRVAALKQSIEILNESYQEEP